MLPEAELFVMAEEMLVEVLGRIRAEDRDIVLPPLFDEPGADRAATLREVVEAYVADDARVPGLLAADQPAAHPEGAVPPADLLRDDPQEAVRRVSSAAVAAAGRVTDGDLVVQVGADAVPVRDHLLRLTVKRSLVGHYVAAYLGSTACPLPEELARPLWELTSDEAAAWRSRGVFRVPLLPLPPAPPRRPTCRGAPAP